VKLDFCVACGDDSEIHFHHLVPRSRGGSDSEKNLLTLCPVCHGRIHSARYKNGHSELTKAGLARRKALGLSTGGRVAYGLQRKGSHISPCKKEQKNIELIVKLRGEGLALRAICRALDAKGIKPRNGHKWNHAVISRIIAAHKKRPPS